MQLETSRRNLGLKTIDCYFLHNPEMELDIVSRQTVLSRIKTLFVSLEKAVTDGLISMYGLATWHAFKVTSGGRNYLQLEELVNFAKDAAGNAFYSLCFSYLPKCPWSTPLKEGLMIDMCYYWSIKSSFSCLDYICAT